MPFPAPTASIEERLEALEAYAAIGQLASRYAVAVDSRNLDDLVALFLDDVDSGSWGRGRPALKAFYGKALTAFYRSIHQVCGHKIDLIDANHATGRVYCRAEHEDGGLWVIMAICYEDEYERRDGVWHFARRKLTHWYSTDWRQAPQAPQLQQWPGRTGGRFEPALPHRFPTWNPYWAEHQEAAARLSEAP